MMETEFTPFLSLLGGAIIGLAAVILMWTTGRIAGVSGMVSRVLPPLGETSSLPVAGAFVVGLLFAVPAYTAVVGSAPVQFVSTNLPLLIGAGLLVGYGAVLGNGCTSGHGVCGISRLSLRSIIATATFMLSAFVTVFVLRHVIGG